jgi:hypothetical protein
MGLLKDLQGLNAAYAEVVSKEAYTVTAADKKGNTPAYQGYKAGKKNVKTGKPLYKAADHLKKEDRESKLWDEVAERLTELHQLGGVQFKVVPLNEHHQKDASGKVIEHGDGTPSSLDEEKGAHAEMDRQRKAAKKLHKPERWQDDDGDGKWYEKSDVDGKISKREKEEKKKNQKEEVSDETKKLIESGKFSNAEIAKIADIQEADIADILARLEKKRISKGGNPDDSPLPAMKKYHADKKKKAKK